MGRPQIRFILTIVRVYRLYLLHKKRSEVTLEIRLSEITERVGRAALRFLLSSLPVGLSDVSMFKRLRLAEIQADRSFETVCYHSWITLPRKLAESWDQRCIWKP